MREIVLTIGISAPPFHEQAGLPYDSTFNYFDILSASLDMCEGGGLLEKSTHKEGRKRLLQQVWDHIDEIDGGAK